MLFKYIHFYFKSVFYFSMTHCYFYQRKMFPKVIPPLISNFVCVYQLFNMMLKYRQQILFLASTEMTKYDYTFFKFSKSFFEKSGDLKKYTNKISVFRNQLSAHGLAMVNSGLVLNVSSVYGTLLRHIFFKNNILASVHCIPTRVRIDFLLSNFISSSKQMKINEYVLLNLFETLGRNAGMTNQASQQFMQWLKRVTLHKI